MTNGEPDREAANLAADEGERVALMEPMTLSEDSRHRPALTDLALELGQKATGLRRSLPDSITHSLSDLVRAMNCYYSNLIENHNTHPIDIERARNNDYSEDPEKRNLQLEATAHIAVQEWIDAGGLDGRAFSQAGIKETHKQFCELLPDELLWVENPETGERIEVVPGEYREHHVQVGRHIPVSAGAIPRFMERFEQFYNGLGRTDTIFAAAAAHHRLAWIHPFIDGNGRVMRLMSHAVLRETLDTGSIWSVARGLARNVDEYKQQLAACDMPRRNDLDGRGHLSEESLAEFVRFFLTICVDQVDFMEGLVQPNRLRERVLLWAEEEGRAGNIEPKGGAVLEAILYRGELPRADVANLINASPRTARRVIASLTDADVITSESSRAPLQLKFSAKRASRWMPGLFPEEPE